MSNFAAIPTLAVSGAFHGINSGMGWAFAVSISIQERDRKGVLRAVLPITPGHAISIGANGLTAVDSLPKAGANNVSLVTHRVWL